MSWYRLIRSSDLHTGQQLVLIQRLHQEIVDTHVQRAPLLVAAARRDHDHGQCLRPRCRANPPADLVTVDLGHDEIEEHEIGWLPREALERLGSGAGALDCVPTRGENGLEQAEVAGHVVDDQNPGSHD